MEAKSRIALIQTLACDGWKFKGVCYFNAEEKLKPLFVNGVWKQLARENQRQTRIDEVKKSFEAGQDGFIDLMRIMQEYVWHQLCR